MHLATLISFCSLFLVISGNTPDPEAVAKEVPLIIKPGYTLKIKLSVKTKGLEFTVRDHRQDVTDLKVLPAERRKFNWRNNESDRVIMMIGVRKSATSSPAFVRVFDSDSDGAYVGWSIAGSKESDYNDIVARISIVPPVTVAPEDTFETLTIVANTSDENKEGKPERPRGVSFVIYELRNGMEHKIGALDGAWATKDLKNHSSDSVVIPIQKTRCKAQLRLRCSVPGDVDWKVEFVAGAKSKAGRDLSSNESPMKKFEEGVSSELTWDFSLN